MDDCSLEGILVRKCRATGLYSLEADNRNEMDTAISIIKDNFIIPDDKKDKLYNYVYLATLSLSKVWGNRYEAEVKDVGLMLQTLYLPNLKYKGDEK